MAVGVLDVSVQRLSLRYNPVPFIVVAPVSAVPIDEWKPIMDVPGISSGAVKGGCQIIAFINTEFPIIKEVMPRDNRYRVVNPITAGLILFSSIEPMMVKIVRILIGGCI